MPLTGGWWFLFLAVAVAAAFLLYGPVWSAGAAAHTPVRDLPRQDQAMQMSDHRFVVWMVARGARALVTHPLRFFEGESCYPTPHSVTLGEPLLTMALLGVPPLLVTSDPELAYNMALLALTFAGMLGMFLLVSDWTGQPLAGIGAALLYAFGIPRLGDPVHPYVGDLGWTAFAMFFARRLFATGRWRNACGLAGSIALQMGTSVYPMIAAALLGVPFAVWLFLRYGMGRARWSRIVLVAVPPFLVGLFIALPFLSASERGAVRGRETPFHLYPGSLAGALFTWGWLGGWPRVALAALGLLAPRRHALRQACGDPRPALVVGALLTALAAMGPAAPRSIGLDPSLNLWDLLAALIPSIRLGRAPALVAVGFMLAVEALAGIGLAVLIGVARQLRSGAVAYLALLAIAVECASAQRAVPNLPARTEPAAADIEFFRALERLGNRGPIFEWPHQEFAAVNAERISLIAYHHRPTSMCLASFSGPRSFHLFTLARQLPNRAALLALHDEGFTTLLVHHRSARERQALPRLFEPETSGENGVLRVVYGTDAMTAYAIEPGGRPSPGSPP